MTVDAPPSGTDGGWLQKAARQVLLLQALVVLCTAAADRDRRIYWNASNPLFQPSGENVIQVRLQDRINFVCPNNGLEYYQIYWTLLKEEAQACSGGAMLFSCRLMNSYLVYVQIFPADPTAPGFLYPVYFYTPSTGDLLGLGQTSGGACQSRNMRIAVKTDGDDSASSHQPPDGTTERWTALADKSSSATRLSDATRTSTQAAVTLTTRRRTTVETSTVATPTTSSSSDEGEEAPSTTEKDEQRADFSRVNLITGSSVAMPTGAIVAALTCCSLAAARLVA